MNRGLHYQGSFATFRWHSTACAECAPHLAFRDPFSLAAHGSETNRPLPLWIPAAQEANLLSRSFFLRLQPCVGNRISTQVRSCRCYLDQQWGRYGRTHADLSLFWLMGATLRNSLTSRAYLGTRLGRFQLYDSLSCVLPKRGHKKQRIVKLNSR